MPVELVIVRHGESEGNLAQDRSKAGDHSEFAKEGFTSKHTSKYRLTDKGRLQASLAGEWIRANFEASGRFDFCFCSEYVRAMETAAHLHLPHAKWLTDFYIRERDGGVLGGKSNAVKDKEYADEAKRRERDLFYYAAPGGESIANSCLRVDLFLQELSTNCSGLKVIVCAHRTIMHSFRILLERTKQADFLTAFRERTESMENCHILHYSRRNPLTGEVHSHVSWMRSINPLRPTDGAEWHLIERPHYSNKDLIGEVTSVPQVVNNTAQEYDEFLKNIEKAKKEIERLDLVRKQWQATDD